MIEIKDVTASLTGRRRFYALPHEIYRNSGLWREPSAWGGRGVLSVRKNELLRWPHAMLLALEDGRPVARVLTGAAGGKGYFSLFDAYERRDAVRGLMRSVQEWQAGMGSTELIGPISPVIADVGGGVLCEGYDEDVALNDVYNAPYYGGLLRECGLQPESEWLAFRVRSEDFDAARYEAAAGKIKERFGLTVRRDLTVNPRELTRMIRTVMGGETDPESVGRTVERLLAELEGGMCPVVFEGMKPVAFLLTMRSSKIQTRPRALTVWVDEAWRRKGITALLFSELFKEAARLGCPEIDASQIKSDHYMSINGLKRAGGRPVHRYLRYRLDI